MQFETLGYDGFTQKIVALLPNLPAGIHTIKIAISDVGDVSGDSAIFLEGASLANGPFVRDPEGIASIRHNQGTGDQNLFRDQGQVKIHSNTIRESKSFGIAANSISYSTDFTPETWPEYTSPTTASRAVLVPNVNPRPGPARNLVAGNNTPAEGGFAPGVTIANNTIYGDGLGGIHVSGSSRPWELTVRPPIDDDPSDLSAATTRAGDQICDGERFFVSAFGETVIFEWEDVGGIADVPCGGANGVGSDVDWGDGWDEGNIPADARP